MAMYSQLHPQAAPPHSTTAVNPMVWNGQQWVPQHPQPWVGPPTPPASLVATYTRYYHGWARRVEEWRRTHTAVSSSQQRALHQNTLEWLEYYRDNASRAAHYFAEHPYATSAPSIDLPGDPDLWRPEEQPHQQPSQFPPQQQQQQQQQQQPSSYLPQQQPSLYPQQPANPSNDLSFQNSQSWNSALPGSLAQSQPANVPLQSLNGSGEESFKRYFDRCMRQCTTPTQKLAMKRALEEKVTTTMTNGSFATLNWDREPSLPVLGTNSTGPVSGALASSATGPPSAAADTPNRPASFSVSSFHSYYGATTPATTVGSVPAPAEASQQAHYYGPSHASSHASSSLVSKSDASVKQHAKTGKTKRKWSLSSSVSNKSLTSDSYYGPANTAKTMQDTSPPSPGSSKSSCVAKQKKAKAQDTSGSYYGPSVAPASSKQGFNQSHGALLDRAKRFASGGSRSAVAVTSSSWNDRIDDGELDKYMGKGGVIGGKHELDESDYENMKVKGTCRVLEKEYLRLTAPPRPELVRPLDILEQHLGNLKRERSEGTMKRDYNWFCSQLKAIRQDCTVQHIRNAFTVDVYETHARFALEEGDLNEFNQCQTQLKELYRLLQNQGKSDTTANQCEFTAYRLLYCIFLSCNAKYTGGSSDVFHLMDSLTPEERIDAAVDHALNVRMAVADVDYHAFFCLHRKAPNLGRLLMDRIVPTMRNLGLQRMFKAYRPSVGVDFVLNELGIPNASEGEFEKGFLWLESCGCLLSDDKRVWNTKDTEKVHESMLEEKKSLI